MKRHIITAIVSAAAILATSCTDDKEQIPAGNDKSTFVNLTLAAYESPTGSTTTLRCRRRTPVSSKTVS